VKEESKQKIKNPAIFWQNLLQHIVQIWQFQESIPQNLATLGTCMHHHIKAHCIMLHNNLRQMMGYHSPFKLFWQKLDHFQKKNDDLFIFPKKISCTKCQKFFTPIL
jgi:hypothetical protein